MAVNRQALLCNEKSLLRGNEDAFVLVNLNHSDLSRVTGVHIEPARHGSPQIHL